MAILDFAVRPDNEPPPYQHWFILGGRLSSHIVLMSAVITVFHVYCFREWNFAWGFCFYIFVLQFIGLYADAVVSNSFGKNIQNLRRAGFTDAWILGVMEFNTVGSQLLGYLIMTVIVDDPNVCTWAYVQEHANWSLLGKVVVNLLVAEVLFGLGHGLMHTNESLMKLHVMHHCSTVPSWNTNTLFHPIDLAIEFGGPATGLLALHYTLWQQDQLALAVTYVIFQLWYAYDHDENLGLYHIRHHTHCDSLYVIYSNVKSNAKHNKLKGYMKDQLSLVWPQSTRQSSVVVVPNKNGSGNTASLEKRD